MDEIRVKSEINRVSVYPDRALITRRCFVEIEPGVCEIVFDGMPASVVPGSLRAKGSVVGNDDRSSGIRLLDIEHRPAEVRGRDGRAPRGRRRKLEDDRAKIESRLENLRMRRTFFLGVAARTRDHVSRQLTAKELSIEECDTITGFLFENLARTDDEIRKAEAQKEQLAGKILELESPESPSDGAEAPDHEVRLQAEVPARVKGVLELSYVVRGARWTPFYEAWAAPDSGSVKLQAYGIVSQTGEEWPEVKLTLSTVPPPLGVGGPDLEPFFLRPSEGKAEEEDEVEAALDAGDNGSGPDGDGHPPAEDSFPEGSMWNVEAQSLGTVPPDGSPVRVLLGEWDLKAEFEYVCIPKMSEVAFLRARVKNTTRRDLLPGRTNLFSNSDFVGTEEIPLVPASDDLELHFGTDAAVRVRSATERQAKGKGGVISKVQRKGIKTKLVVQNTRGREKPVVLIERLPLSGHKEIRVRDIKFAEEPKKKSHKGIYIWQFPLKNKEKRELQYSYTVEYPRGMRLQI